MGVVRLAFIFQQGKQNFKEMFVRKMNIRVRHMKLSMKKCIYSGLLQSFLIEITCMI